MFYLIKVLVFDRKKNGTSNIHIAIRNIRKNNRNN